MCNKLRKVIYTLPVDGFYPDVPYDENAYKGEELMGFFHCWTDEIMLDKDLPYVEKLALVEDSESGKIHRVHDSMIQFTESPE